ncbi:2-oxo-4-hydroxy-4-carboxy-5-ureidoimidazoline decarboxylase [Chlorogloea sp. CCALA 695]|uniref:2-oxo-4-hydroxy-4-carboxy-5-ureidoimidazoline decarboxylase n=1 Tax=Chlorogloea sp. CCALA 695 TaxID=2107693 RepID=UPI000D077E0F|nr:2-oxo-4-hydroxy-4-carboxy-5-ureidoimidazoline decarboxylase [Chlorogloea sp. CCALA 695]PSB30231.1 OHCU decarboxylase [Chlorogloea sp. CCALA 695]
MFKSITQLNQMSQEEFVNVLGTVFEHTPQIAQKAWNYRPFVDATQLHQKMVDVVSVMSIDEQLALIRVHPDLGSKALMAENSVEEQTGLGLDRLTAQEYDYFQLLNQAYKDKFGFPFIIAVKNHTKDSVLDEFERRLKNTVEVEIASAIAQINKIAWFRTLNLVE